MLQRYTDTSFRVSVLLADPQTYLHLHLQHLADTVVFTAIKRDTAFTQVVLLYFPAVVGHSYAVHKQNDVFSLTARSLPSSRLLPYLYLHAHWDRS